MASGVDRAPAAIHGGPAKAVRRGRRVAAALGGLVALALLLAALAPTFVSWGLFRGSIVAAIGDRVNGTVSIDALEVGWRGPLAVRGLVIDDPAAGTRIVADLGIEQGLWALATGGTDRLDLRVSGSLRTRREPDGSLSVARLARPAPAGASAAAGAAGGGAQAAGGPARTRVLPVGLRAASLAFGPLDVEVADADGGAVVAVRGASGSMSLVAGGPSTAALAASCEFRGTSGSIDVSATLPGLLSGDGSLSLPSSGADITMRAAGVAFEISGTAVRVPRASATVRAESLSGRVDVAIDAEASCDGEPPASLKAEVALDRLLAADGSVVLDLSAIHGSVALEGLPTRPFERFAAPPAGGSPMLVLARDLGPSVSLDARFADATGGDVSIDLRADRLRVRASGSVDPATRAASFRSVEADATLAPALLAALGVEVAAPSNVRLRASELVLPAAGPDGSFPIDRMRVAAELSVSLAGLRVPGPDGPVPLDVRGVAGSLRAAPVSDGIECALEVEGGAPGSGPSGITIRARRGGPFGLSGTIAARSVPTSLVRPFLPRSLPVDLARDLGATIARADLSLTDASPAAFAVALESPCATADLRGTVSESGAVVVSAPGSVGLSPMSRDLLAAAGIAADADLSAGITIRRLELPPASAFDLAKVAIDADVAVRPFAQPPVGVRLGPGDAARVVRVYAANATVTSAGLGTQADAAVLLRTDHADVDAKASAKGLGDLSAAAFERARFSVDLKASGMSTARLEGELPALKGILPELGDGAWDVAVSYAGSILEGNGSVSTGSGPTRVQVKAAVSREAVVADAAAATQLKAGLPFAALLGELPVRLGAPVRLEAAIPAMRFARRSAWDFSPPDAVRMTVRSPRVGVAGVPGLSGSVVLQAVAVDAEAAFASGGVTSARATIAADLLGLRPRGQPVAVAPVRAGIEWSAGRGDEPGPWKGQVSLEGIKAAGLGTLIDLDEAARAEIGDGARIAATASGAGPGRIAFELDSGLKRLSARLKGEWDRGEVRLADGTIDLSLPAAQATELLNAAFPASARPDGSRGPAWESVDPVSVRATIASLRMRPGSLPAALVARAEVKPFAMTAPGGARVAVDALSASVDAPSPDRPATVVAQVSVGVAGAPKAKATLDAKVSSWLAADGTFAADAVRINGGLSCPGASTRAIGALLGAGDDLEEALGPEVSLSLKASSGGPGVATASATLSSRFANLEAPQVTLRAGVLAIGPDKPLVLDFSPSPKVRSRYLTAVNPILGSVSLAPGKRPFRLTVSSLSLPADGALARLGADFRLDVGEVLVERGDQNQLLDQVALFAAQARVPKAVEALVEPLEVTVREGQLRYRDFFVRIDRQGTGWRTTLKSTGDVDLASAPPYARAITVAYPLGCIAREGAAAIPLKKVGGALTNVLTVMSLGIADGTMLRLTVRGPLGSVDGRPGELEEDWDLEFDDAETGKALERGLKAVGSGLLQDLLGGKKPKGGK